MTTDVRVIRCSTLVKAGRMSVWEAIASGAGWDSWFTSGTTLEARPGGELHFVWREFGPDRIDAEDRGEVLDAAPGARLEFTWGTPPSTVRFTLSDHPEGTRVDLHEDGLPSGDAGLLRLMDCSTGWGEALTLMKFWVEHGVTYR